MRFQISGCSCRYGVFSKWDKGYAVHSRLYVDLVAYNLLLCCERVVLQMFGNTRTVLTKACLLSSYLHSPEVPILLVYIYFRFFFLSHYR